MNIKCKNKIGLFFPKTLKKAGKAVTTAVCCCQSNHAYVGLVQIIFTATANGDYASQHKVQSYANFGGNYHKEKEMQTSKLHIAW